MAQLRDRPIVELRAIAQSFGVQDIFEKDAIRLAQDIEMKQNDMAQSIQVPLPERPTYDARLMATHPKRRSSAAEIEELLKQHVALGLHLKFDVERWYMAFGEKTDEGTLRMPLRTVLDCAERIMRGKRR